MLYVQDVLERLTQERPLPHCGLPLSKNPEGSHMLKWTNLQTGKFGYSHCRGTEEEMASLGRRMTTLTAGRWIDSEGENRNYRGKYEVVEVRHEQ